MLFPVLKVDRMILKTLELSAGLVILVSRRLKGMLCRNAGGRCGDARRTGIRGNSMTRLKHPDLLKADKAVDRIVDLTINALAQASEANMSDDDLVVQLWKEFMAATKTTERGAGELHMAMSCYRLALAAEEIFSLREQLDFHKDAIDMLTELDGL